MQISDNRKKILVTGALGQLGSELVPALARRYGAARIVATDIRHPVGGPGSAAFAEHDVEFRVIDCLQGQQLGSVANELGAGTIFHLAALLSAVAENRPQLAWQVNAQGTFNVLEVARELGAAVFVPSSIAAFGPSTPRVGTSQDTLQRPETIYGITKVAGELLCDYYWKRFGVDTRGVRYPGLISHVAEPGGGTTDYAVEIFRDALRYGIYNSFLEPDTCLDMMYMPDAIKAALELMEADPAQLTHRNAFNITAFSCTPALLATEITRHLPDFRMRYDVDPVRQAIAESWPDSLDDSEARHQWGWNHDYGLEATVADMLENLGPRLTPRAVQPTPVTGGTTT